MEKYDRVGEYIAYLRKELGLSVTVKDFVGFLCKNPDAAAELAPRCVHQMPFCMAVKGVAWDTCQRANQALFRRCASGEPFWGQCHAGYSELVIPVRFDDRTVGAVCAGGFEWNAEESRTRRLRLPGDAEVLEEAYRASVAPHGPEAEKYLSALGILADFLKLCFFALYRDGLADPGSARVKDTTQLTALTNAIECVHMNYAQDLHLKDICAFCGCSESYLSHLFKQNMRLSVSEFINRVRIDRARELIADGVSPLSSVASLCGFSDPNYFSGVFKRIAGATPSAYRREVWGKRVDQ